MKITYLASMAILATQTLTAAYGQQSSPPQSLAEQLQAVTAEAKKQLPAEVMQATVESTKAVKATGIEKTARQAGQPAIDAEMTGWDGKRIQLSSLWRQGPVVLMWYRGGWCPYCNVQLAAMQQELDKIEGAGAKLVVLTPELPEKAQETAAANSLSMVALYDANNVIAKAYGLVFKLPEAVVPLYRDQLKITEYNGNDSMELPLAATYVIDQTGMIRSAFLDADYSKRAEPSQIVAAVEQLVAERR